MQGCPAAPSINYLFYITISSFVSSPIGSIWGQDISTTNALQFQSNERFLPTNLTNLNLAPSLSAQTTAMSNAASLAASDAVKTYALHSDRLASIKQAIQQRPELAVELLQRIAYINSNNIAHNHNNRTTTNFSNHNLNKYNNNINNNDNSISSSNDNISQSLGGRAANEIVDSFEMPERMANMSLLSNSPISSQQQLNNNQRQDSKQRDFINDKQLRVKWKDMERTLQQSLVNMATHLNLLLSDTFAMANNTISLACRTTILDLLGGVKDERIIATQMLDASARLPSGILDGTLTELGNFNECLNINNNKLALRGSYCTLQIKPQLRARPRLHTICQRIPTMDNITTNKIFRHFAQHSQEFYYVGLRLGVCVPSKCNKNDIQSILDAYLSQYELLGEVRSCQVMTEVIYDNYQLSIMSTFAFILLLAVIGTLYEVSSDRKSHNDQWLSYQAKIISHRANLRPPSSIVNGSSTSGEGIQGGIGSANVANSNSIDDSSQTQEMEFHPDYSSVPRFSDDSLDGGDLVGLDSESVGSHSQTTISGNGNNSEASLQSNDAKGAINGGVHSGQVHKLMNHADHDLIIRAKDILTSYQKEIDDRRAINGFSHNSWVNRSSPANSDVCVVNEPKRSLLGSVLLCFSVIQNTEKLVRIKISPSKPSDASATGPPSVLSSSSIRTPLSPDTEDIQIIHGLRVLTMTWIIFGHSIGLVNPEMMSNIFTLSHLCTSLTLQALLNATLGVNTFFTVSGIVTLRSGISQASQAKSNFSPMMWILMRYLRLTPTYATIIGISILLPTLGSGPFWAETIHSLSENCRREWWTNLFYINNIFSDKLCLIHSWYLSNDFQFHLLGILLIAIFLRSKMAAFITLLILLVSSSIMCGVVSAINDFPPTIVTTSPAVAERWTFIHTLYYKPWPHLPSYLIGLLAGYCIVRKNSIHLSRSAHFLGWFISVTVAFAVLNSIYPWNMGLRVSPLLTATWSATFRTLWSACIAWLIFASAGEKNMLSNILSWEGFQLPSRLTFAAYLVHPLVIYYHFGSLTERLDPSIFSQFHRFMSNWIITYLFAFFVALLVESPALKLQQLIVRSLVRRDKSCITKNSEQWSTTASDTASDITCKDNLEIGKMKENGSIVDISVTNNNATTNHTCIINPKQRLIQKAKVKPNMPCNGKHSLDTEFQEKLSQVISRGFKIRSQQVEKKTSSPYLNHQQRNLKNDKKLILPDSSTKISPDEASLHNVNFSTTMLNPNRTQQPISKRGDIIENEDENSLVSLSCEKHPKEKKRHAKMKSKQTRRAGQDRTASPICISDTTIRVEGDTNNSQPDLHKQGMMADQVHQQYPYVPSYKLRQQSYSGITSMPSNNRPINNVELITGPTVRHLSHLNASAQMMMDLPLHAFPNGGYGRIINDPEKSYDLSKRQQYYSRHHD